MGVVIVLVQEVHVVRRNQADAELLRQLLKLGIDHVLLFDPLLLHFDEESLGAENFARTSRPPAGRLWRRAS